MRIQENVPISKLTTMRLGGPTKYLIEIEKAEDIKEAYDFAKKKNLSVFVLGGGANTIGHDEGFNGVIITNKMEGIEIQENGDETIVTGMGGEDWPKFAKFISEKGYSGIEGMSAIPGTLGAAPVQNIGAYSQEIADVIESVKAYDTVSQKVVTIKKPEMGLAYRKSIFNSGKDKNRYFIISVTIKVKKGELKPPFYRSLQKYIDEHHETDFSPANISRMITIVRADKLPDPKVKASSGSFFKNVYLSDQEAEKARAKGLEVWTENGKNLINSGWLIEQAGLKGKEFFGMKVNEKAALVLINEHAKDYSDLAKARSYIQKVVKEKFGYMLEQEPVEIPIK